MILESNRNLVAAVLILSMTGVGCHTPPKAAAPPPSLVSKVPVTRAESTAELEPLANQLDQEIARLPGSDGTEHRHIVVGILNSLIEILQLANGPHESPAFANRTAVVTQARDTIANQTIPRTRMEAAENQALLAAVDALDEISTRDLFDDKALPDLVNSARDKVTVALKSQGPMHDLDAADALTGVRLIVREETDAFVERFGSDDARARIAQRKGALAQAGQDAAPTPMPPATAPSMTATPSTAPAAH